MVPPFVGAVGMKQLLGRAGAFNALLERIGIGDPHAPIDWLRDGRFAVVVALTALHLYPIVYFNVQAALAGLNPEMEEAGAQPRLPRAAAVPQDHAAVHPPQRVRGGQHRLHLGASPSWACR